MLIIKNNFKGPPIFLSILFFRLTRASPARNHAAKELQEATTHAGVVACPVDALVISWFVLFNSAPVLSLSPRAEVRAYLRPYMTLPLYIGTIRSHGYVASEKCP